MWMWLVCAIALERIELKMSAATIGSKYNGYGAIDAVLERRALAPMAYRVLVPWLVGLVERIAPKLKAHRFPWLYMVAKIALLTGALYATSLALGTKGALIVAALLPMTFYFDYWDWMGELAGVALALTGNLPAAMIGGVIAGWSKETAALAPLTYGLLTRDVRGTVLVGCTTAAALIIARLWGGAQPLYCQRFMVRENWGDLRHITRNRPVYLGELAMSLVITGLVLVAVVSGAAGPTWPVPLALLAAGWTMARAAETRIFASTLLWIAMLLGG
jgi:hypothetical protein